jgi:CheY-like chemotaxis protein
VENSKEWFLIDDDIDDQEIFLMALQEVDESINCVIANDGVDGLKKLNDDPLFIPDYIFLDVNMPKMNGMQCLPEIKKLPRLKDVKIIMFSTSADSRIIRASKELGANDFVVKPAGLSPLIDVLKKISRS